MKIYIAGSLFTSGEQRERKQEGLVLREVIQEAVTKNSPSMEGLKQEDLIGGVVFNPIENPFNDKSTLPTAEAIYSGDQSAIEESNIFFFNLDNITDGGVFMELGQVIERLEKGKNIKIYPIVSDMRAGTAGEYDGVRVPWGYNQYVIGGLLKNNIKIYSDFPDALEAFIKDNLNNRFVVDGREVTNETTGSLPHVIPISDTGDAEVSSGDQALVFSASNTIEDYVVIKEGEELSLIRKV